MHINYFIVVKRQEKNRMQQKQTRKKSYATISISRKNPIKR